MKLFQQLWKDESGQGMVEYGLILALIAIAVIVVLTTMGDTIRGIFGNAKNSVENVNNAM